MIRFDQHQPRIIKCVEDIPSIAIGRALLRVSKVNPVSPPLNAVLLVVLTFLRDRYEQWRDSHHVNCCDFFPEVLTLLQSGANRRAFEKLAIDKSGDFGWEYAADLLIVAAWHSFQASRDRK
jgi:hypothetical protein